MGKLFHDIGKLDLNPSYCKSLGIFPNVIITPIDRTWTLPTWAKEKILAAVKRDEKDVTDFLKSIERSVISARSFTKKQAQSRRANLKEYLKQAAKAAKELVSALESISANSDAVQTAKALHTMVTDTAEKADPYLSKRGADSTKLIPERLAGTIAYELQNIGIKPTVSRPKENIKGEIKKSSYWQVTEVCFELAEFLTEDLRNHLRKGLEWEHTDPKKIGG